VKKYIALFSATLILTIGYFLSITIPLAKDNASGLFAIFEDFFDEESYSDTKYIALNPDNIDLEDQDGITYLMKRYCFFHGHTFLFKTFDELIDEGYIVDGGFEEGIVFGFDALTITEGSIFAEAYIYKGNLGAYGKEFTVTFANREWTVTTSNMIWMS